MSEFQEINRACGDNSSSEGIIKGGLNLGLAEEFEYDSILAVIQQIENGGPLKNVLDNE